MKHRIFSLFLGLTMAASLMLGASAAEYTSPVTLTVVNTEQKISVTVPASLPVSVVDGYVVTATNAAIKNNAESGAVKVTGVSVQAGAYAIGSYDNFAAALDSIALSINGCGTVQAGALAITGDGFPSIEAGKTLPILYWAKVSASKEVKGVTAATVVFTIAAEGGAK